MGASDSASGAGSLPAKIGESFLMLLSCCSRIPELAFQGRDAYCFPATLDGNDTSECGAARRCCPPERLARSGRMKLDVADQSAGFAPEQVKLAFEPFAHGRTAAAGSGLRLAIVRGIAKAHAGPAGIESRPGRGATFWIRVPA